MSREHEYRAWLKQEQKMYEVSVIHFGVQYGMAPSDSANLVLLRDKSQYYREGQEVELMEYIGLKDRKGNKIYKDDVVKGSGSPMQVMFLHGSFVLADKDMEKRGVWTDMMIFEDITKSITIWEIIGNVYENPELAMNDKEKL